MTTEEFILNNRTEDIRRLALKARPAEVDVPYALEQIAGWQAARTKLPTWAGKDGIVFPPHLSMEQCSSEPTALYKQQLAERLTEGRKESMADLTGGFGVDFSFMAQGFRLATYVERQEKLCQIARNNMPILGIEGANIVCADGTEYLNAMPHVQLLFLDPARRDDKGARTFAIQDCTPDVVALHEKLIQHADNVVIKLSPMLDWHKAIEDMPGVSEVHIVSVRNECKELLLVLRNANGAAASATEGSAPIVFCVDCKTVADGRTAFSIETFGGPEMDSSSMPKSHNASDDMPQTAGTQQESCAPAAEMFVYEPNASVMKGGFFAELSSRYGARQVARNSHLFLSPTRIAAFPGRAFAILTVTDLNKKELKRALVGITKANIAVRNFPLSVAELRKRLKLADGGEHYIFATTLANGQKVLLICTKDNG